MAFDKGQFKDLIVRVTTDIGLYSPAATNLLLGTAAKESEFGTYLRQLGRGPALGAFQMEPATHADIWDKYLGFNSKLSAAVSLYCMDHLAEELEWNLAYAIVMCRVHYKRVPAALPAADDLPGMAHYWKVYYNTVKGAGTEAEFIKKYKEYVL